MDPKISLQELGKTLLSNPFTFYILIFLPLVITLKIKSSKKLNSPPSPPKLPIIGNLHQLSSLPHRSITELSKKYGPLMLLHLSRVPTIVVSSIDIAKEIFKTHDVEFSDRPSLTGSSILLKGCPDMGFGAYSDHSREAKNLCILQLLSQRRVNQFHFIREEEVRKLVEKIRVLSQTGHAFNISDLFMTLAHKIVCRSVFGCSYEKKDGQNKSSREVARRAMDLISAFCFKDLFPFLGWVDHLTGLIGNLKETAKELSEFLDQVIKDRLALMNNDEKLEDKKYLVDILLHLQKEGVDLDLCKDNIKAILMDMFLGGIDTSATTMEWMMAELMKNPRMRRKAQEEVRRIVGKKPEITQADVNEMKYLKCIMKETLRFRGSSLIPRLTTKSVKLQGYDIPEKARVFINMFAIQRDPELWDNPEKFVPERHLSCSDSDVYCSENKEKLLYVFGGGKRKCPGMSYAYAEIEYVMANLLYWFNWELGDGVSEANLDMNEVSTLNVSKKTPLCVVAHPYMQ